MTAQQSMRSLSPSFNDPHYVVFVEDGQCIQNQPPKYIAQMPEEYLKIQSKFNKRAYKELLEICTKELTQNQKTFSIMYAIDGEVIESIDDIDNEAQLIIVGTNRLKFKGLINIKDKLGQKELRVENAKEVKTKLENFNKEWANQKYLEWVERICDKFGVENMQIALAQHANNEYLFSNSFYRKNLKRKLGPQNNISPTFQGGGLKNCDEFLLPQIEKGNIREELQRLRSNNFEKHKDYQDKVRSARWDDHFVQALEKFKEVNQPKEKIHLTTIKPGSTMEEVIPKQSCCTSGHTIDPTSIRNFQTQLVKKEAKVKTHLKQLTNQTSKRNHGAQSKRKALSYEECKGLSDEYLLPCKVIYELHSEYNSLLDLADEHLKHNGDSDGQNEEEDQHQDEGVPLKYFQDSCTILKEKHPKVIERILLALNISIMAKNATIGWKSFLLFYALMKYYTATQKMSIAFWMKFFNPQHMKTVSKDDFIDILEKLARGSYTEKTTLVSIKYSSGFYKMLVDKNCVREENGDVIVDKFEKKLLKNEIDIEYLNQTLKQDCDYILDDDLQK